MKQEVERKEIESVCTYCGVGCDITGVVEDNRIGRIYAQKDGVVSQGSSASRANTASISSKRGTG